VGAHDVASSSGSCKTKMLRRCDVDLRKQNTYYSGLPVLFIDRPCNQFRSSPLSRLLQGENTFYVPYPTLPYLTFHRAYHQQVCLPLPRLAGFYPALANILDLTLPNNKSRHRTECKLFSINSHAVTTHTPQLRPPQLIRSNRAAVIYQSPWPHFRFVRTLGSPRGRRPWSKPLLHL